MIGKRLNLARASAGLSLRGLQERIGSRVSAQQIGKYERDEDVPSLGVLVALSDALGVSAEYLTGDQNTVLESVEFRKKRITSKREQAQIQAKVLQLIERYLMVEDILALPNAQWDKPTAGPYPVHDLADAEGAAQNLREQWNLGIDPIQNLVEVLEERGVKVLVLESQENIDGLAAHVLRSQREPIQIIVIRRGVHGERQRFSLAHELAHMVMNIEGDEKFREKAANRFAGAFLMPAEALWSNVGRHRNSIGWSELFALKLLFGASIQAITYRCGDLEIFPPALSARLFQEFSRLGYRSAPDYEPNHLTEEKPGRFERLCYRALAEGAISEPNAAEMLNITVRELNRRMEEPTAGTEAILSCD